MPGAGGENITTKYKLDVSELKAGISEANRALKENKSALNAIQSEMDKNGKSVESMSKKYQVLQKSLEAQKSKLEAYSKQLQAAQKYEGEAAQKVEDLKQKLEEAKRVYGENSAEVQKYQKELSAAEKEHNSLKTQVSQLTVAMNNQEAAVNKSEKELNDLGKELEDVAEAEEKSAKNGKSVEKNLKEMGDEADKAESKLKGLADSIGKGLANAAKAGIAAVAAGVTAFLALGESSQETMEDMGKLEAAFTSAGHSSDTAKETFKGLVGVLGETDQAVEAANHLAQLTKDTEELSKWTDIAAGVYATFGDSLPLEGLTEAANETAKVGQVTGPLADALNWAGISEDAFNEKLKACTSEQERATLITETLSSTYMDAATAYKEVNGDLIEAREATAEMNTAMADLGQKAIPITTEIKKGFTEILTAVTDMLGGMDSEKIASQIRGGFQYFIDNILPAIKNGFQWIIDNKEALISGIVGIGTAMAALNVANIIMGLVKAWQAYKTAQEGATVAQWLLNAAMAANPVGLIVAAIVGLVAAFATLWATSEDFRNFWINLWEQVKSACQAAWEAIKGFFLGAWDSLKNAWTGAVEFFKGIWTGIQNVFSTVREWFREKFEAARTAIETAFSKVKEFFQGVWKSITDTFSSVAEWFREKFSAAWNAVKEAWSKVKEFFQSVWNTITQVFSVVSEWFRQKFSEAWEAVKNAWAKSKEWAQEKWNGIKDSFASAKEWFKETFSGAWNAVKEAWSKSKEWATERWEGIKSAFGNAKDWFKQTFSGAWEAVKSAFSGWSDFFGGLWNTIKDKFSAIGTHISDAIGSSVKSGINGVIGKIEGVINNAIGIINGAINLINLLPGVNVGKVGKVSFPRLAKGGVLKKGQVGLLEGSGAEAVVPLERNKYWIKSVAGEMLRSLRRPSDLPGDVGNVSKTVNNNYTQVINAPKSPSRLEIYRQTKNLLAIAAPGGDA